MISSYLQDNNLNISAVSRIKYKILFKYGESTTGEREIGKEQLINNLGNYNDDVAAAFYKDNFLCVPLAKNILPFT